MIDRFSIGGRGVLLALFFFTHVGQSKESNNPPSLETLKEWANLPEWNRLLHIEDRWFFQDRSEAEGDLFFLSSRGREDPVEELRVSIELFQQPISDHEDLDTQTPLQKEFILKLHPRCRFPARATFIEKLVGKSLPKPRCAHLEQFYRITQAKSVSVVFSSFFLGGASSTFGHTFIRLNRGDDRLIPGDNQSHHELLDFGVNYAARVTTQNPLLYAIYGMTGGFPGEFAYLPYYLKVREYQDFEARDLWSYELNLSEAEVQSVVDHIWELGQTWFQYYYFTRNCSYHMFSLLDAAVPRLNLVQQLSYDVIPSDTIRTLYRIPGLVRKISYRPSSYSRFQLSEGKLNSEEKKVLQNELSEANDAGSLNTSLISNSKINSAKILDAALDFYDFRYPTELQDPQSKPAMKKHMLSIQRAKFGVQLEQNSFDPPVGREPHLAHGPRRVGLESRFSSDLGFSQQISYRFALHDPLDPPTGFPDATQIEFMHLKASYFSKVSKLRWDELKLFQVLSLDPVDAYRVPISYRVELGLRRMTHSNCVRGPSADPSCLAGSFDLGMGWSKRIDVGTRWWVGYLMPSAHASYSPSYLNSKAIIGIGPRGGFVGRLSEGLHLEVSAFHHYLFLSSMNQDFSFLVRGRKTWNDAFGVELSWTRDQNRASVNQWALQSLFYF